MTQKKMNEEWIPYTDQKIPEDEYEIIEITQNSEGTFITLYGDKYQLIIHFVTVYVLRISDEGKRLRTYNEIPEVEEYYKHGYSGNPMYIINNSEFMEWITLESAGFCFGLNHYLIITRDDIIDIAATFPPEITIEDYAGEEE